MSKKNKKEELVEPEKEEDYDTSDAVDDDEEHEEDYNTSMQIGAAIHKQSEILKRFPQLAKEVKYSFFNELDKRHFYMRSRTYQDLNYMKTIFHLSYFENVAAQILRKTLYDITTKDQIKIYLDATNQTYLWYAFKGLSNDDFKFMLAQLKEVKDDGIMDSVYSQNTFVRDVYDKLADGEIEIDAVDEMGLINDIYTTTEASKAKGGNERASMNTTISVTSDQNEREQQQERGENPFITKAKSFMFGPPKKPAEEQE